MRTCNTAIEDLGMDRPAVHQSLSAARSADGKGEESAHKEGSVMKDDSCLQQRIWHGLLLVG